MRKTIKASKILIIKMDVLMNDIHRLWKNIDSPYTLQKRKLSEARSKLYSDTKLAYKLMKKAHAEMIEESLAAQEYNYFKDIIPQIKDYRVENLNSKYHEELLKGNYKKACEIAKKISLSEVIVNTGHSIEVKLEESNKDSITYVVRNESTENIPIRRFVVTMNQVTLQSDMTYPFVISHNTYKRIHFSRTGSESDHVKLFVEYEEDGLVKTMSIQSYLKPEA